MSSSTEEKKLIINEFTVNMKDALFQRMSLSSQWNLSKTSKEMQQEVKKELNENLLKKKKKIMAEMQRRTHRAYVRFIRGQDEIISLLEDLKDVEAYCTEMTENVLQPFKDHFEL